MLSHYSRTKAQVDQGIEEARVELNRAKGDATRMGHLRGRVGQLADRAEVIRERNGFDELMERLVKQGGTRSHGGTHGGRA